MATDMAHSPDSASASVPVPANAPHSSWDQPQSGRATPQDYSYNTPPSYAGSFGSNPDSSGWPGDEAASYNVLGGNDDYNPTDFDVQDASPSDFNHLHFFEHGSLQPDVLADLDLQPGGEPTFPIHLSFTPADPVLKHPQHHSLPMHHSTGGDMSSPGSSPGSVHNNDRPSHSRASSVSSVHSHHSPMPVYSSLSPDAPPQFSTTGPSPPTSPQVKAQSPPALVIPTDTPNVQSSLYPVDQKPTHLLPGQPSIDIHIVPSTPISAGVANSVPFQQVLHTLNQQNALNQPQNQGGAGSGGAQDVQDRQQQFASAQSSPRLQQAPLAGPPNAMEVESQMWTLPHPVPQPHGSPSMSPFRNGTPSLQHFRHPSDESVRLSQSLQNSPAMPPAPFPRGSDLTTGLVNLNLGLHAFGSGNMAQTNNAMLFANAQSRHRSRSDTSLNPPNWGPNAPGGGSGMLPGLGGMSGLGLNGMGMSYQGTVDPSDVLARDPGGYPGADQFGGMQAPFKMQPFDDDSMLLDVSLRRSRTDSGQGHRRNARSDDFGRGGMYLVDSQQDLLRSITTPDGSLAPSDPRILGSPGVHRRNSSRGHERGSSLSSSARPSPYPSPSASPRHLNEMLPGGVPLDLGGAVSRPHVTTPATANASSSRRKSEANFVCPVPGCGSTFTRHFNLKGHLRSHNEERPFKCKWPGCEKGFARQHDCKRHEALHLNIRPYTCEGCSKTFARMDALNRHLRSEGGVECRRLNDDGEPVAGFDLAAGGDAGGGNGDSDEWTPHGRGLVL